MTARIKNSATTKFWSLQHKRKDNFMHKTNGFDDKTLKSYLKKNSMKCFESHICYLIFFILGEEGTRGRGWETEVRRRGEDRAGEVEDRGGRGEEDGWGNREDCKWSKEGGRRENTESHRGRELKKFVRILFVIFLQRIFYQFIGLV